MPDSRSPLFLTKCLVLCIMGGLLIAIGGRDALSSIISPPQIRTFDAAQAGKPPAESEIDRSIHSRLSSLQVRETAQEWSDLGFEYFILATSAPPPRNLLLLQDTQEALLKSVKLAPANPYAWLRLALAQKMIDNNESKTLGYWHFSMMTGLHETQLSVQRAMIGIEYWSDISLGDRSILFQEIYNIWKRGEIWQIANDASPFTVNIIRASLAVDPKSLIEFELFEKNRSRWKNQNAPQNPNK